MAESKAVSARVALVCAGMVSLALVFHALAGRYEVSGLGTSTAVAMRIDRMTGEAALCIPSAKGEKEGGRAVGALLTCGPALVDDVAVSAAELERAIQGEKAKSDAAARAEAAMTPEDEERMLQDAFRRAAEREKAEAQKRHERLGTPPYGGN